MMQSDSLRFFRRRTNDISVSQALGSLIGNSFFRFLNRGEPRSVKAKRHALGILLLKCVSILTSFLLVPIMIQYLGTANYGIWLTLGSAVSWINFFDIGLGNGLRNKFALALASGQRDLARTYVSTTYAAMVVVAAGLLLVFSIISPFVSWHRLFNAPVTLEHELAVLVWVVFVFFTLRFILRLIGTILVADQRPALESLMDAAGSLMFLSSISVVSRVATSSLLYVGIAQGLSTTIPPALATVWFFRGEYRSVMPSLSHAEVNRARELIGLGVQFFIIQVAVVVIFSTANVIIIQLFGPSQVTVYNVAFKYFSIVTMVFAMVTTPLWSAYTEAYQKGEVQWIRRTIKMVLHFWALTAAAVVLMIALSQALYRIWVGTKVDVPPLLSIAMGLFVLISTWNNVFVVFINGVGKIRLQLYTALVGALINVPLSIFLGKTIGLGAAGVTLASCVCLLGGGILNPMQYKRIINGTARGIWAR